jgi:membrane-associated phospholipid phosphatase
VSLESLVSRLPLARSFAFVALAAASLSASSTATACEPRTAALALRQRGTPTPLDRLGCNLVDLGGAENLFFYGAAILSTVELSATYADHDARVTLETYAQSRSFSEAMVLLGYLGPPSAGALLYGAGLLRGDHVLAGGGAAAIQAMSITFAATVLLKVATGRPYPNHGGDPDSPDRLQHPEWSREWNGPRLENSAWPSGHTSVAVSFAAALTAYYWNDAPWVGLLAYPVAGAVGYGVVSGADHWLSDAVAGALIGQAVGWTIGRDFRRMQDTRTEAVKVRVVPLTGATGLAVVGAF